MLEDYRLKIFLKLAQTASFTVAARELGITQPAVSQSLTNLEKTLGVKLLTRTRGKISLTSEGRAFAQYAEKILYWYNATEAMFGERGKLSMNRPVKISADPVVTDYLLPPVLSTLNVSHPELSFELRSMEQRELYSENVFDYKPKNAEVPGARFGTPEDADLEISIYPSPKTIDFEGEGKLVTIMEAAVVSSPYNKTVAGASEDKIRTFSTLSGIHISNKFAVWEGYRQFLPEDVSARSSLNTPSVEAIKTIVASSDNLVGIVPEIAIGAEVSQGKLIQLPVHLPWLSYDVHFNPLPEFANKSVCKLLYETIKMPIR